MIEGNFVKWFDKTKRFGIVDKIDSGIINGFVIDKADASTVYYNEPGGKDNVKIESKVLPVEIMDFCDDYGVYSKTYGEDGMFSHPNDGTIVVIGSEPVEKDILRLLRDHTSGKDELQKTYSSLEESIATAEPKFEPKVESKSNSIVFTHDCDDKDSERNKNPEKF